MNMWTSTLRQIGLDVFGRESSGEMWTVVAVCVVLAFLFYKMLSSGFAGRGEKTVLTLVPGVLIMSAVVAAVRIYLDGSLLLQAFALLVGFLVIVLPLTAAIEKTGYFNAMIPWVVTAIVLVVFLYLEPTVMNVLSRGVEQGSLMEKQRDKLKVWDRL